MSGQQASISCDVLCIGGGSTGAGITRDAAMRGLSTVLVERGDLATGTTGRFHGLLHSGGRYVVKDPTAARECAEENVVLRRIAADCIEDTGGLFVTTPLDDPAFGERFLAGCRATGVPVEEITVGEALRREPRLNPRISRAFLVQDASVDAWKTVWTTVRSAQQHGARILPHHAVAELIVDGDRVGGAVVADRDGRRTRIEARMVVNATGAWAGQIAAMAGLKVNVRPGKGIMIAMNHRLVNTVVNRCTMPADGDIIVPIRTVSVIGTTDVEVADPDDWAITADEVHQMLEAGEILVPGFRTSRALRAWGGVRPLYQPEGDVEESRDITRAHTLLDHASRDGMGGLLTITGGKFCTYRLMAEQTVDAVCAALGEDRACRTAEEVLPDSEEGRHYWVGARLAAREATRETDQLVCECEMVPRSRLQATLAEHPSTDIDDLRRQLRIGMGPCQGGFCMLRTAGVVHDTLHADPAVSVASLRAFAAERRKGVAPLLYGDQLRQTALDEWILHGVLDVDHAGPAVGSAEPGHAGGVPGGPV